MLTAAHSDGVSEAKGKFNIVFVTSEVAPFSKTGEPTALVDHTDLGSNSVIPLPVCAHNCEGLQVLS